MGSYPTVSPLPEPLRVDGVPSLWPSAVCFLWCRCRIAPPGRYPASYPWSPDFPLVKQAQRASTRAPPARTMSIGSSDQSFNRGSKKLETPALIGSVLERTGAVRLACARRLLQESIRFNKAIAPTHPSPNRNVGSRSRPGRESTDNSLQRYVPSR